MIEIDLCKRFTSARNRWASASRQGELNGVEARFSSSARVLALFGRSGSGKSTVVNMIAGLVAPERGRVVIDGETLFDSERGINVPVEQRGVGYVFQEGLLFPHLSVRQNLEFGAARRGGASAGVPFDQVVSLLGIEPLLGRSAPTLSGGEKQRVAIGRALLSRPRLLLMDEPLAALDTGRRSEILRLIERVRDECNVRIVYVSHSIGEVSRLADDVVLMNEGAVIACGGTEEIFNRSDLRPYTGRFEGGALIEAHAVRHDARYFLTTFAFDGGELIAPGVETAIGARVRIRIRARDVTLATTRPQGISVRNVIEGRVAAVEDRGGAIVEVRVQLGASDSGQAGRELLSRISRQALDEMQLVAGQPVFVLIKAIAFDKRSMGFTT
jgi:molybdate transport system ATP-binding protein